MADSATEVPSRQETEELFTLPPVPTNNPPYLLPAGIGTVMPAQPSATLSLGKKVAGYAAIDFLAISDQTMSLLVEEANDQNGPFVPTGTLASALAGTMQMIRQQFIPVGSFMRVTLTNTGADETVLSFKGVGLPMT
jgi:hypothetical protein